MVAKTASRGSRVKASNKVRASRLVTVNRVNRVRASKAKDSKAKDSKGKASRAAVNSRLVVRVHGVALTPTAEAMA